MDARLVICICIFVSSAWAGHSFLFEIKNVLKAPKFQHRLTLDIESCKPPLITYMENAVDNKGSNFTRFTATYFPKMGYFIDAINKVEATYEVDKTWWSLVDGNTGKFLTVGVSTYIPKIGDYIIANFTSS